MRCPGYPSSCSDQQWELLEPLLPPPGNTAGKGGRGEKHPRRLVLDAILNLVRGGITWRALPKGFPPPTTVRLPKMSSGQVRALEAGMDPGRAAMVEQVAVATREAVTTA